MDNFYRNKKVLITGGGGLIGSHLVESLITKECNVRVILRSDNYRNLKYLKSSTEIIRGDLLNYDDCLRAVKGIDIVFDLAAVVGNNTDNYKHPGTIFNQNTRMSTNMLEAVRNHNVERYMCSSSNSVYSEEIMMPNLESDGYIGEPHSSNYGYSWAKRFGEIGSKLYSKEFGLKVAIARISNTYGPHCDFSSDKQSVITGLIKKVFNSNDHVVVWGSGNQKRSFIFVKDVVNALIEITQNYANSDPINIATQEEITISDLVKNIISLSGKKLDIIYDNNKPEGQIRKISDSSKLYNQVNWSPMYTLKEGLKETIDWYKENYKSM